jgi:MAP/microtubule affinity-regulating kinase
MVRLAFDKMANNLKVAIKTYEKFKLYDSNRRKNVKREIAILSQLEHPNIIKLNTWIETPTQYNLVMEYVSDRSLYSYLKSKPTRRLPESEARHIFRQIVSAIEYCHIKNVVHRDVKLENILLDDNNRVKLIDFGFSIVCTSRDRLNVFCGTPSYMAPEIVNKIEYVGAPVDVWSLGIVLFALLCGKFPFRGNTSHQSL